MGDPTVLSWTNLADFPIRENIVNQESFLDFCNR